MSPAEQEELDMIRTLIRNWALVLFRGLFALVFAIFIFLFLPFVPAPLLRELAFAGLTVIFALFATATGIITIVAAVRGAGQGGSSWLLLADGIVVTTGGLVILFSPGLTLLHVIQLIGFTSLLVGALEVMAGIHLRRHLTDERLLLAGGIISIVFAFCLFLPRSMNVQAVLSWLSLYATANGLAMVGLAWRLRGLRESIHALAAMGQAAKAANQSGVA
jgi:uncharacterized membrane protein HdeD (DUF308 family)